MKTKTIPFDLETAKKIQAGEIEGKIKTRGGKHEMRIVCYDSTADYLGKTQPIIAQHIDDCCFIGAYFEDGHFTNVEGNNNDLVLEVPDTEREKHQFKPFDRVLVRDNDTEQWRADFFSHMKNGWHVCTGTIWRYCIPYEDHEHLIGTTDKPKDE